MFRLSIFVVALLVVTPLVANAGEITLLPAIKLSIGDRDYRGYYWDGGRWRDRDYWHRHYHWRDRSWHRYDRSWHPGWRRGPGSHEQGYRPGWHNRGDRHGYGRPH